MQTSQSQDRIAGALAYVAFFIPILMERQNSYTCFHMRQAFLLFVVAFIGQFIPIFGGIISFIAFVHMVFLAWKAYVGEKFSVPYIYPYSEKLITLLQIEKWFTPKL